MGRIDDEHREALYELLSKDQIKVEKSGGIGGISALGFFGMKK